MDAAMVKAALSSSPMQTGSVDLAQVRFDNALALFEEFVRSTARHADAVTLRGLERRFAERVQIQPSYWSQIKGRSRQIGERLARQFEQLCHKPRGWMDQPHGAAGSSNPGAVNISASNSADASKPRDESMPRDDDERFIVGLVLTYYRRHPDRARTRLLDLLGEVLTAPTVFAANAVPPLPRSHSPKPGLPGSSALTPAAEDAHELWLRSQSGVSPIKRKK